MVTVIADKGSLNLTPQSSTVGLFINADKGSLNLVQHPSSIVNNPRIRNVIMGQSQFIEYIDLLDSTRLVSGQLIQAEETHVYLIGFSNFNTEFLIASDRDKQDWSLRAWISEAPRDNLIFPNEVIEKIYFNRTNRITNIYKFSSRAIRRLQFKDDIVYFEDLPLKPIIPSKSYFLHLKNVSGSEITYEMQVTFNLGDGRPFIKLITNIFTRDFSDEFF